jgi:hypothetical protein
LAIDPPGDDMSYLLEKIQQYKMTDQETRAYKVCLIWMKLSRQIMPDYQHCSLPKSGDPRKSHLFRMAWKLLREMKGILADSEIALYIRAQLEILRGIKHLDGTHVMVDPICLCGEKAWVRWKVYKKKFESSYRDVSQKQDGSIRTSLVKIAADLDKTMSFFKQYYPDFPAKNDLVELFETGMLVRWASQKKISPYYIILSDLPQAIIDEVKKHIDLDLYQSDITQEVVDEFRKRFPKESA